MHLSLSGNSFNTSQSILDLPAVAHTHRSTDVFQSTDILIFLVSATFTKTLSDESLQKKNRKYLVPMYELLPVGTSGIRGWVVHFCKSGTHVMSMTLTGHTAHLKTGGRVRQTSDPPAGGGALFQSC